MTTALIPATVKIAMRPWVADILTTEFGWDGLEMFSSQFDNTGVEFWVVSMSFDEAACPASDILEAARHCIHTLKGWADETIEIV